MSITIDKVTEYLERLAALHHDIREWLNDDVEIGEESETIREEGIDPYQAKALTIKNRSGKRLATLTPIGTNIIGAEGQVRLVGPYDTRIITYFVDAGPAIEVERRENGELTSRYLSPLFSGLGEQGWYVIVEPRTGATKHLDMSLFQTLLTEVSDYGQ